jgi:hypothetical protein
VAARVLLVKVNQKNGPLLSGGACFLLRVASSLNERVNVNPKKTKGREERSKVSA